MINGLQVNVGGMFDREYTKRLMIRDFDDVLKYPFRCEHLFLLHTLLSKKNSENLHAWPVTEGPILQYDNPIERGLALALQKYLKLGQFLFWYRW